MHDHVMIGHYLLDQARIADVALDESVAGVRGHGREVLQVPGICQLVQHGDLNVARTRKIAGQQGPYVLRTDETSCAGGQDLHFHVSIGDRGGRPTDTGHPEDGYWPPETGPDHEPCGSG